MGTRLERGRICEREPSSESETHMSPTVDLPEGPLPEWWVVVGGWAHDLKSVGVYGLWTDRQSAFGWITECDGSFVGFPVRLKWSA